MKKILLSLFVLFLGVVAKSQNGTPLNPVTQSLGGTSTLIDVKGGQRIAGAFVLGHYADTTAANAVPYVKNFANGLITTDTNLLWIRSYNAQQWYFVPNTGNPATGDTLYWRVGGNALIPMQQQGIYTGLGSKDSTPLFFITNYQRRLVIPPNGVNRSAGTANKCLVIDTVTKFMYYTDCGSGGGTTYTFPYSVVAPGNAIQLENDTTDNPANYFYGRNSAGRRGWYPQSGIVGSTPTLQQVLTAGNDVTTNQTITTNSTVFRIKLDEDQDGVGFTGLNYNGLIGFQNGNGVMQFQNGSNLVGFDFSQGSARVQSSSSTKLSAITTYFDSVVIYPQNGNLKIDSLNYTLSTTGKKILLRDTATGLVENIDPALLTSSPSLTATYIGFGDGSNQLTGSSKLIFNDNLYPTLVYSGSDPTFYFGGLGTSYPFISETGGQLVLSGRSTSPGIVFNRNLAGNYAARMWNNGSGNLFELLKTTISLDTAVNGTQVGSVHVEYNAGDSTSIATDIGRHEFRGIGRTYANGGSFNTFYSTVEAANTTYPQDHIISWQSDAKKSGANTLDIIYHAGFLGDSINAGAVNHRWGVKMFDAIVRSGAVLHEQVGLRIPKFTAAKAGQNYHILADSSDYVQIGGNFSFGADSSRTKKFNVDGTVRLKNLGTASGDTTTYKPLGISSSGDVFPMTYWPGGGGSGWGTTGTVATLTGASTLAMGTNNFTFASTGQSVLLRVDATNDRVNINNSGIALGALTIGGNTWINGDYLGVNNGGNQGSFGHSSLSFYNYAGTIFLGNNAGVFEITPIAGQSVVINEPGYDADFRVEGDNDANLIFADAGNDKVGIGTASPTTKLHVAGRFAATQGADVASAAGAITLGTDGNTFEITGTAAITLISNAGWVNGSEINLIFTSTATLTDGTANSGTDIGMELAGNANFTASADDVLTLVLCEIGGVQRWREKSRSVN